MKPTYQFTFNTENLKQFGCINKNKVIQLRSSWELEFMQHLIQLFKEDNRIKWCNECTVFNYFSSVKKRMSKYIMDFTIFYPDGSILFIEIKPHAQTLHVRNRNKNAMKDIRKKAAAITNFEKWESVKMKCNMLNKRAGFKKYKFKILTEKNFNFGGLVKQKKTRKRMKKKNAWG